MSIKMIGSRFFCHGWSVVMALLFMPVFAFGQYQVAFHVSGGSGSTTPSGFQNLATPYQLITAIPDSGYEFVNWTSVPRDVVGDANSVSTFILLSPNDSNDVFVVSVNFQEIQPVLTANHTGNGAITVNGTPNSTAYTASYNENVSLVAVPDPGSLFFSWSGDISGTNTITNIVMTSDMTVSANFIKRAQVDLIVFSFNGDGELVGNPIPMPGLHRYDYGSLIFAKVDRQYLINPTKRVYENGFIGTGSVPASGHESTGHFAITTNSSATFNWRTDYKVSVTVFSSNGVSSVARNSGWPISGEPESTWNEDGSTVTLTAMQAGGEIFQGWAGQGVYPGTAGDRVINVIVDAAKEITALFDTVMTDSDADGLPDLWELKYGLDRDDSWGDNGPWGDPDNDGLPNIVEYRISYEILTNELVSVAASPINADSDGDGLDDGYEFNYIMGTSGVAIAGAQQNALAVVDPIGDYGPHGNLDGDYHWSTNSGYETSIELVNIEEYTGPDDELPGAWPPVVVGTITKLVNRYELRIEDSGDQSLSSAVDSENAGHGDGFDDGFEYSWDRWQRMNAGIVSRIYITTNGVVTNVVPAWTNTVTRHFNPAVAAMVGAQADNDLVYDSGDVSVGGWLTDELEYHAASNAVSPILRIEYPDRPRCTNPFLWDTDGDRLPDGWEMAFGYDPWKGDSDNNGIDDGDENPDEDWFARDGTNKHYDVYLANGFHPRTGYGYTGGTGNVNSARFTNYEELIGPRGYAAVEPNDPDDKLTDPFDIDTDSDGIWDGWEWYVNLDARSVSDRDIDVDNKKSFNPTARTGADGLSNFEEFNSLSTSAHDNGSLTNLIGWFNKVEPTDPWDMDTDGDQLTDGEEHGLFNVGVALFNGGGLCPTSADTDGDHLPDAWESEYAGIYTNGIWTNGMNGTFRDANDDADADGLPNYQEYMIGSVSMWQFVYNNGLAAWQGFTVSDEPYDWFDEGYSNGGQWDVGGGGRTPHDWDPHKEIGNIIVGHPVQWNFITAAEHNNGLWFSTSDPTDKDTDGDDMDDYWEVFHGLNPLYGSYDIVRSKVSGMIVMVFIGSHSDQYGMSIWGVPDLRLYPWISGSPEMDPDQDELPNIYESAQADAIPPYYHTDPSPMWITDASSPYSWVNSQYSLGGVFGRPGFAWWYWDDDVLASSASEAAFPPVYVYSFEINEGYDTDNDNLADHAELVDGHISGGVTDPLESQSPIKRRALYLDGTTSAARLMGPVAHENPSEFRTFTLEAWVRPENPASGSEQIIIERSALIPQGNGMGAPIELRCNFKMGIDGDGYPYVLYNGAGNNIIFIEAKAASVTLLPMNEWTHLAATYGGSIIEGGQWSGMLKLYVNGELVKSVSSSVIPQNDWYGTEGLAHIIPMTITIGAGDNNPNGWVCSQIPFVAGQHVVPPDMLTLPVLHHYFEGWVDQVHIWNGARTGSDIRDNIYRRYARGEVAALRTTDPGIRYAYSFDDLPDPDHAPIVPAGFDLLNGRDPNYVASPWWAGSAVKSLVYVDYRYIPWIDNLAGHGASEPPVDTLKSNNGSYPNTSNPYVLNYFSATKMSDEWHPFINAPLSSYGSAMETSPDVLPLGFAMADEDIEMWDGGGLGTDPYDTDGDGMSDEWETKNGFDPRDDTGDNGGDADGDADGVSNLNEYLLGIDPHNTDTDGDGVSDFEEIAAGTDPINGASVQKIRIDNIKLQQSENSIIEWSIYSNKSSMDIKYILESGSDLLDWNKKGELVSGGDSNTTVGITDTNIYDLNRMFYRLKINVAE